MGDDEPNAIFEYSLNHPGHRSLSEKVLVLICF